MFTFKGITPKNILFNGENVFNVLWRTAKVWANNILTTVTAKNVVLKLLLPDSAGENIVDYKLYGHSYFNGTPTPEAPVTLYTSGDYDAATGKYKFPIVSSSHNVFDITLMPTSYSDTYKRDGNTITVDLTNVTSEDVTNTGAILGEVCPELKSGDKIVWYSESTSTYVNLWLQGSQTWIELGKVYTVTDKMLTSQICLYGKRGEIHTISKICIYNNVKEYEIALDEPLRRYQSDEFADYIDFENQKVVRHCGSWVLTGYEPNWYTNGNYTTDEVLCLTTDKVTNYIDYHPSYAGGVCNKFAYKANSKQANGFRFSSSIYLFISLDKSKYPAFNDDVRQNVLAGTEIIYIRNTPIEEPIELPEIETEEGENLLSFPLTCPFKNPQVSYYQQVAYSALNTLATNSGNIRYIALENAVEETLDEGIVYGHGYQSGTPTPESPVEIQTTGDYDTTTGKYRIPFMVGSNKVKGNMEVFPQSYETSSGTLVREGNTLVLTNTTDTAAAISVEVTFGQLFPELKVGDTIMFDIKTTGIEHIWIKGANLLLRGGVITITQSMLDSPLSFYTKYSGELTATITELSYYKIVKDYSAYLDEPLRRVYTDEFCDYIDFANKTIVRNCGSLKLTGQEDGWYINGEYTKDGIICLTNNKYLAKYHAVHNIHLLSNKFKADNGYSNTINTARFSSSIYLFLTLDATKYTLPENFAAVKMTDELRNAIAGTEILYIRKESLEESIELPDIELMDGDNMVSVFYGSDKAPLIKNFKASYYKCNYE